uniref:Uncharacterized protein n=1 Tax=Acrobeloides nanus TaxID=290746 RepID=A0A914DRU0_9BILA
MDSNIKKELVEEIKQLDIKQEDLSRHSIMTSQAAGFSSVIEVDAAVSVNVGQYGIQIVQGTTVHDYYHGRRVYNAECSGSHIKVTLNGLQQQGRDINGKPITVNTSLTLIFDDSEQFVEFREQIRRHPNNYTIGV